MPALNLDLDYFDHPKTRRLIGLLGRGAEVLPIRLWTYCGKYHRCDGSLASYSPQEIESIVGWWGKPGALLEALLLLKFLDEGPDGFRVHDWNDHAGHFEMYHLKAKGAAIARWKTPPNASSMPQASLTHAPSNAPAGQGRAGQGIGAARVMIGDRTPGSPPLDPIDPAVLEAARKTHDERMKGLP